MEMHTLIKYLPTAIAPGGSITFAYPAGMANTDFTDDDAQLVLDDNTVLRNEGVFELFEVDLQVGGAVVTLDSAIGAAALSTARLGLFELTSTGGELTDAAFNATWLDTTGAAAAATLTDTHTFRVRNPTGPLAETVSYLALVTALSASLSLSVIDDVTAAIGYYATTMTEASAATDNGAALTADAIAAAGAKVMVPPGDYDFGGGAIGTAAVDITSSEVDSVHIEFAPGAKLTVATVGKNSTNVLFWFREGVVATIDGGEFDGGAIAEIFARTSEATANPGGELTVKNAKVHNFGWTTADSATVSSSGTIGILLNNSKRLVVDNCQFYDFRSREDGNYGDQDGKSTFIQWFNSSSGQQNPATYSITNCEFDAGAETNEADDFDAIHILQQAPLANGHGVIHNCRFKFHGKSRRVFKYQGGGVHMITHCHVEPTATCLPSTTGQTSIGLLSATDATPGVFTTAPNGATPAVTISQATPGVVTHASHGKVAGTPVVFATSGALPAGLTAGTVYYVVNPVSGSYEVSATPGGASIDTTDAGSGTHTAQYGTHGIPTGTPVKLSAAAGGTWNTLNGIEYMAVPDSQFSFKLFGPVATPLDTSALGSATANVGIVRRISGQGQAILVASATAAAPGVFSTSYGSISNPHGFVTGDLVRFRNMAGGTWSTINEIDYYVEVLSATTFRVYALSLLDTSALGTYTGSTGSLTRINGVTNEGMAIVDWAGSNAGRLEISDCHFDGRGMRNGIVQTTGKGASVICRDSTIIGNRYDSNRFVPDSGANEVALPTAFLTAADDVDSALINCDVYGWARATFLAGKNNNVIRNRFFDPRTYWIQVNTLVREGLVVEDNTVITRTPYSLNASVDGVTADFARCGEIRNWTNLKVNRNTLRQEGNTLHGTRFIAFIVNGATGQAEGNRVLPEGTGCHAINYSSGVAPINSKTGTAVAGAVTLNAMMGKITTEPLTTAAAATYTLTITNDRIVAVDHVYAEIANGTNSAGTPVKVRVTPAAGSVAIVISNEHAANAFNGTLVISFKVEKA